MWVEGVSVSSRMNCNLKFFSFLVENSFWKFCWPCDNSVGNCCEKGIPFLNCHLFKCPSQTTGRPWETSLKRNPKHPRLINQRCRLSFIAECYSLSHAVCGCWSTLSSVSINTRTHTLYLSLSLRYLALFPHLSVSFKKPSLRLFDYQLKYRFHCIQLFSFHR
jgi:hypothetical protein